MALTQQIFINRCKTKHGEKYDYTKTVYTGLYKEISISCPLHGHFTQIAANHMSGNGCRECGKITISIKQKGRSVPRKKNVVQDTAKFINKAILVHGQVYDYTQTVFTGWNKKILINCKTHGRFKQSPGDHIHSKNGCPLCGVSKRSQTRRKYCNLDSFKQQANLIHNNIYDYSAVYIDSCTYSVQKVPIKCNIHGTFYQSVRLHLKGHGCSRCAHEYTKGVVYYKLDKNKQCNVYLLELSGNDENFFKIGITLCNVKDRISSIPYKIKILDVVTINYIEAFNLEQNLLQKYKKNRYQPLKKFGGESECFLTIPSKIIHNL